MVPQPTVADPLTSFCALDISTQSGQKVFAKRGDQPRARAYIRCYPDKKIVIALLCNTEGKEIYDLGISIGGLLVKD